MRSLIKTKTFWFYLLIIIFILIMRFLYFDLIGNDEYNSQFFFTLEVVQRETFAENISYILNIITFFLRHYPYTLIIFTLGFGSIVFIPKPIKCKASFYALFATCLLISAFFVLGYTVKDMSHGSGSISRYLSLITFLIPMLPALALQTDRENVNRAPSEFVLVPLFIFLAFMKVMIPMPMLQRFSLDPGSYQNSKILNESYLLAQSVKNIIGEEAKILITDDLVWGPGVEMISNTNEPAIYVRYYLMYQSVGAQYNLDASRLFNYAMENDADYILVLNNDFLFDDCEDVFTVGNNFLMKTSNINGEPPSCNLLINKVIPIE